MLSKVAASVPLGNPIAVGFFALVGTSALAMAAEKVTKAVLKKIEAGEMVNGAACAAIGSFIFSSLLPLKLSNTQILVAWSNYFIASRFVIPYLAEKIKSYAKPSHQIEKTITLADIAGNPEALKEMQFFVDYVRSLDQPNSLYREHHIKPKGMLFFGPPGTGKTLFAQALAGETGCPFISMHASELSELYVGTGPKAVREHFQDAKKQAKKAKKPCILFIDEVDSIALKRSNRFRGINPHDFQTITSILTRAGTDEFSDVFIILATNRREDIDEALLRSGRINAEVEFKLPSEEERVDILKVLLKKDKLQQQQEMVLQAAKETDGFSGADLANVIDRVTVSAIKRASKLNSSQLSVIEEDFKSAIAVVRKKLQLPQNNDTFEEQSDSESETDEFLSRMGQVLAKFLSLYFQQAHHPSTPGGPTVVEVV